MSPFYKMRLSINCRISLKVMTIWWRILHNKLLPRIVFVMCGRPFLRSGVLAMRAKKAIYPL